MCFSLTLHVYIIFLTFSHFYCDSSIAQPFFLPMNLRFFFVHSILFLCLVEVSVSDTDLAGIKCATDKTTDNTHGNIIKYANDIDILHFSPFLSLSRSFIRRYIFGRVHFSFRHVNWSWATDLIWLRQECACLNDNRFASVAHSWHWQYALEYTNASRCVLFSFNKHSVMHK